MKILVLTDCPSPYQVELFNAIEAQGECSLEVAYLRSRDPSRQWKSSDICHAAIELNGPGKGMSRACETARTADLVVFNYYRHANAEQLIDERAAVCRPWCFWGERPGFHQPAWAGRLLRRWKLAKLHGSAVPIWGIGKFAVDGYRREFGAERAYFNLPYFSDLDRFNVPAREEKSERTFLFSGSLIPRKGVDLLAAAFVRLAQEFSNVKLRIVGEGELRVSLEQTLRSVSERVDFVGFRDWEQLPAEYARADVLCVPSRYDGWGLVVPEGLAAGLPVIATDRMGSALEFVESGRNGWLIRAGNQEAVFEAMRAAAKGEPRELGRRARESVSEHTLVNGALRFVDYAREAITNWSPAKTQRRKEGLPAI
ncbi:MAG TPA: glycosyltransferase family 4 protein [Pyrinomonadaceae bacterium]|nr:glycosyltransferase family 4 protein [Pyrinomonadaceae bacterium]